MLERVSGNRDVRCGYGGGLDVLDWTPYLVSSRRLGEVPLRRQEAQRCKPLLRSTVPHIVLCRPN